MWTTGVQGFDKLPCWFMLYKTFPSPKSQVVHGGRRPPVDIERNSQQITAGSPAGWWILIFERWVPSGYVKIAIENDHL